MPKKLRWLIRSAALLYLGYVYLKTSLHSSALSFLTLNSFLAYIPIECAFHVHPTRQRAWQFYPLAFLWLIFYPNTPYLLTDLFHLAKFDPYNSVTMLMRFDLHLWLAFFTLVSGVIGFAIIGTWSLEFMATALQRRWRWEGFVAHGSLVVGLTLLTSIGVFVGRFIRLHTAYLFVSPGWVVSELVTMWNLRMVTFVLLMTILQLVIWGAIMITKMALESTTSD